MNRGFVILAQNSNSTDYVKCAEILAYSIKKIMPNESVSLISSNDINSKLFDNIISLPHGDVCADSEWKLANDWQIYEASPYEYTIKLEADMYIPRKIDWWWDILKKRDLNICTTIRNYKGEISNQTYYRNMFTKNKLPDTYNAITYFKKSELAKEFYNIVRIIFENWKQYTKTLDYCSDEYATTDVVYGLAAKILGAENCTMPWFNDFSMVHMKKMINNTSIDLWYNELVVEIYEHVMRVATHVQLYPIHYHTKSFANIISEELNLNDYT